MAGIRNGPDERSENPVRRFQNKKTSLLAGWFFYFLSTRFRTRHLTCSGKRKMASLLVWEKHFSAASLYGNHIEFKCSLGARTTGNFSGTCNPKTCSVFSVTPGAKRCLQTEKISNTLSIFQSSRQSRDTSWSVTFRTDRTILMPVSSNTSLTAVCSSGSDSESLEPVTDCQNPGRSARSINKTSSSFV